MYSGDVRLLTPDEAEQNLVALAAQIRAILKALQRAQECHLLCRMELGRLLLEIRTYHLWAGMPGVPCKGWVDFLETAFPKLTGLSARTAYDAIGLAESSALNSLSEDALRRISTVASARAIAKLERNGGEITPAILERAQTQPTGRFLQSIAVSRGRIARVWFEDPDTGEQFEKLAGQLRTASADAVRKFCELLARPDLRALAGGIDNCLDFLMGLAIEELANVEARQA